MKHVQRNLTLIFFLLSLTLPRLYSQCGDNTVEIKITFVTDLNGNGDVWTLTENGNEVLSGGPYTAGIVNTDIQTVCVSEGADILFALRDDGPSGLGSGYFLIESCDQVIAYHTGYMPTYNYASFTARPCDLAGKGEVEVYTRIHRVITSDDVRWYLTDPGGEHVYAGGKMTSGTNYEFVRTAVPEGTELLFRILNLDGGGMRNNGSYQLGYDCVEVASGGDDFDIVKEISFNSPYSIPQNVVFEQKIGAEDKDRASMVKELCEGGYILSGSTGPENIEPLHQAFLVKANPSGEILWEKQYGDNGNEAANAVFQDSEGSILLTGSQVAPGESLSDIYILKTDREGEIIWEKTMGDTGNEYGNGISDAADGYFISGTTSSTSGGDYDAFLTKINKDGDPVWDQTYGNEFTNQAMGHTNTPDGGVLLAGFSKSSNNTPWNNNEADALLILTNASGTEQYYKTFGNPTAGDVFYDVKIIDDDFAIAGGQTTSATGQNQSYLFKFNWKTGNEVWGLPVNEEEGAVINAVDLNPDGSYTVFGSTGNTYAKTQKIFIAQISESGELLWIKNLGFPGVNTSGNYGIVSKQGGYVVAGETFLQAFPDTRPDIYFVKTDKDVALVTTPQISGPASFCEGSDAELEATEFNVGSNLAYSWSNGMQGRIISVNEGGEFTVTVSDRYGNEKTSAAFVLEEIARPQVEITSEDDSIICYGLESTLNGQILNEIEGQEYSYQWSNGDTTESVIVEDQGVYFLAVTEETLGCKGLSDPYRLKVQKPYNREHICMVTVDEESGKNMVIYTKTPEKGTKAYIIWKETQFAYVYEPIGTVSYEELNYFVDENSSPATQADRYKISVLDECDNQSLQSEAHKTMHLTVNAAGGGMDANNLIWDHYEGFLFGTYVIYRGTEPGKLDSIHSIQSTLTSWTDNNPPEGDVYYQVGVRKNSPCVLVADGKKAGSGPFVHSLSNLDDNRSVLGIGKNQIMDSFQVYPNPFTENINLFFTTTGKAAVDIQIYNNTGKLVWARNYKDQPAGEKHFVIPGAEFNKSAGLYHIRLRIGEHSFSKTIISSGK